MDDDGLTETERRGRTRGERDGGLPSRRGEGGGVPRTALPAVGQPDRPDVFISYSRRDAKFVRGLLVRSLAGRGKAIWIDLEDIPPAADWRERISDGIDAARAFVFVLSPASVESEVCLEELRRAVAGHKRLIPVLYRDVDSTVVPDELRRRNWIFLRRTDDFDDQFERLIRAVDTDLEWVDNHARLAVRAREWRRANEDRSRLLRGNDLRSAEQWLAAQSHHAEVATAEQERYILASRRGAMRRRRLALTAVAMTLVVSVVLSTLAVVQRNRAVANDKIALSRELAAQADALLSKDPVLSLLLAVEAARRSTTSEAEEALRRALPRQKLRTILRGPVAQLTDVAFSPDGTHVAIGSADGTARLWDATTARSGAVVHDLPDIDKKAEVNRVGFSLEGGLAITATIGQPVQIWSMAAGRRRAELGPETASPDCVALSRRGDIAFVSGSMERKLAGLYDATTGKPLASLTSLQNVKINDADFSPDGRLLATAGADRTARLWRVPTGEPVAVLRGHSDEVLSVAFNKSGDRVLTLGADGSARIWRSPHGQQAAVVRDVGFAVRHSQTGVWSPDGERVLVSNPTGALIVDGKTGRILVRTPVAIGVHGVAFRPDGRYIATIRDTTVQVWNASTGQEVQSLTHPFPVDHIRFSPDGELLLTGTRNGTASLWEAAIGKAVPSSPQLGRVLAISGDGALALVNRRDGVSVVRTGTGVELSRLEGRPAVSTAAVSRDGRWLVTADSRADNATVWRTENGRRVKSLKAPTAVTAVSFSPDGKRVAVAARRSLLIWDTATWTSERRLDTRDPIQDVSFGPDGRSVVFGQVSDVYKWDGDSPAAFPVIGLGWNDRHQDVVTRARFSADGRWIVSGSEDHTARVWDAFIANTVALRGHSDAVEAASFSPDGKLVVTASRDGTSRVWVAATGELLESFRDSDTPLHDAVFGTDGKSIYSAGGEVRSYACVECGSINDLLTRAQGRLPRALTLVERHIYLHEE